MDLASRMMMVVLSQIRDGLTDQALIALGQRCGGLRELSLSMACRELNDDSLAAILEACSAPRSPEAPVAQRGGGRRLESLSLHAWLQHVSS